MNNEKKSGGDWEARARALFRPEPLDPRESAAMEQAILRRASARAWRWSLGGWATVAVAVAVALFVLRTPEGEIDPVTPPAGERWLQVEAEFSQWLDAGEDERSSDVPSDLAAVAWMMDQELETEAYEVEGY